MEVSIYLAKLIGLYLIVLALIALLKREQFQSVMKSIVSSEGLIAFSGIVSLVAGLAILIGHPIWEYSWRVVISVIGALAVFQGVARLVFTEQIHKKFSSNKLQRAHWFIFAILVVVGAFLTYHGFKTF
jgi:uncharacterized membrane protein HdeD (DUF308 family)